MHFTKVNFKIDYSVAWLKKSWPLRKFRLCVRVCMCTQDLISLLIHFYLYGLHLHNIPFIWQGLQFTSPKLFCIHTAYSTHYSVWNFRSVLLLGIFSLPQDYASSLLFIHRKVNVSVQYLPWMTDTRKPADWIISISVRFILCVQHALIWPSKP